MLKKLFTRKALKTIVTSPWLVWPGVVVVFFSLPFFILTEDPVDRLLSILPSSVRVEVGQEMRNLGFEVQDGGAIAQPTPNMDLSQFDPFALEGAWAMRQVDANRAAMSWAQARRLAAEVWEAQREPGVFTSFYCGCDIRRQGESGGVVDLASCGLEPRNNPQRAERLEWEHVVPASLLGRGRACWTQGHPQCVNAQGQPINGRSCCEMVDPLYNIMANDPVNLVPASGEINADRSNFPFTDRAPRAQQHHGQCRAAIDFTSRLFIPKPERRGDIARIYAYMSRAYGIAIPADQAEMFSRWMLEDPVSDEEIRINQAILRQGHRPNPFVLGDQGERR